MRNLLNKFRKSESGAAAVEYAVILIVVTIIGGAGVIAIGQASQQTVINADSVVGAACTAGANAASSNVTTVSTSNC